MKTFILEAKVTALTAISHNGGEVNGNTASFRRFKVIQPNGDYIEVPHISGNSVRGKLRDISAKLTLDLLGDENAPKKVDLKKFHFLFSGGTLESTGSETVNIDAYKEIRENLIHASLFGGAWGNAILSGKMKINPLIPISRETMHIIPEKWIDKVQDIESVYNYLQAEMFTRKDNTEDFKEYLSVSEDEASTTQMIYHIETLAAGTPFYWKVVLEDATKEELDYFLLVLTQFQEVPVLGGKSAVGFGQVEISDISWQELNKEGDKFTKGNLTTGRLYQKYVEENKDSLNAYLDSL